MTNEVEYRCLKCGIIVRTRDHAVLTCVRCRKVMQRWGETEHQKDQS